MTSVTTRRARRNTHLAQRVFPARTLHLVDIENLTGTGRPAEGQVAGVRRAYAAHVGIGPMDQVVIGCNHGALPAAGCGWPGARYLIRSGPDGADAVLLTVIERENIAARFSHVAIASGDHIFTLAAAGLAAAGCQVTVVTSPARIAASLRLAAQHLIYLDTAAAEPTPARPGAA